MARQSAPTLRLALDLGRRPSGGAWGPTSRSLSDELLELAARWPTERASITGYYLLPEKWDTQAVVDDPDRRAVSSGHPRTRTMVLRLADRSTCRLLLIPPDAPEDVAWQLLTEASDTGSTWRRADFESTFRPPVPHEHHTLLADGSDA